MKDTQSSAINSSHFVAFNPNGTRHEAFNTPSNTDYLTGEPLDNNGEIQESIYSGSSTSLSSTTTASISQPNNSNPAPATLSFQPLTTATNPGSLTVTAADTSLDDILLNGGSIPTMMTFSETDDDILIYDSNSLLGSLTSTQTQLIIPLNGTSVNSGISPDANISANDNGLLITPAESPSNPLANSDLSGISSVK